MDVQRQSHLSQHKHFDFKCFFNMYIYVFIIYSCIVVLFSVAVWFSAFTVLKVLSYFQSDLYPFPMPPLNKRKDAIALSAYKTVISRTIFA